jgi:hypothetical protein
MTSLIVVSLSSYGSREKRWKGLSFRQLQRATFTWRAKSAGATGSGSQDSVSPESRFTNFRINCVKNIRECLLLYHGRGCFLPLCF